MKTTKRTQILLGISKVIISIIIWLLIWDAVSYAIDLNFVFPGVLDTLKALLNLVVTFAFWETVVASMCRILLGLLFGVLFGVILAFLTEFLPFTRSFISIGMTVIKSTPVAAIIMVLWVIIGNSGLPIVVGLLMVSPIIWQNLLDGFSAINTDLFEVCYVFELSRLKTFKLLILPTLIKFFIPSVITSIGLAWKSGIAAEIIAYTKNSIGKNIFDAKNYFEGDVMFAWTLTVVAISLIFEYLIRYFLRRFSKL